MIDIAFTMYSYPADTYPSISVNGGDMIPLEIYYASYRNNTYISIRDLANALSGTSKQFNFECVDEGSDSVEFHVATGKTYIPVGIENRGSSEDRKMHCFQGLKIDGRPTKYRVFRNYLTENGGKTVQDGLLNVIDACMALNLNLKTEDGLHFTLNTDEDFYIDIHQLEKDSYFSWLHGALIGNASTGEIIYSSHGDVSSAIASTSKLMTLLLIMEAMERGELTMDEMVTLSANAAWEAASSDGTYRDAMPEGVRMSVRDLVYGMMLPSANECAIALAERIGGSEEAFAAMMNEKAAQLGMTTAKYYNASGLPVFTCGTAASKISNEMSPEDMFTLCRYILNNYYDQVTAITSTKETWLDTIGKPAVNSNSMLWNVAGTVGLKTGSTTRAGSCLVCALPVDIHGKTQIIITIVFGAENGDDRAQKSEVMLRYAMQYYKERCK